jgi:hypothetical protein
MEYTKDEILALMERELDQEHAFWDAWEDERWPAGVPEPYCRMWDKFIIEMRMRTARAAREAWAKKYPDLAQRIELAAFPNDEHRLERKPKWVRLPSGEWAKITHVAHSDGIIWAVDNKANNFYVQLRNSVICYDDNPPAEKPIRHMQWQSLFSVCGYTKNRMVQLEMPEDNYDELRRRLESIKEH